MTYTHIFSVDHHTVYWGDTLRVLTEYIPDQSVQLIFADPPYNIGKKMGEFRDRWETSAAYLAWCYAWLELSLAKLTPTGSLYLMTSTQSMPFIDIYLQQKMHIVSRIIWYYDSSRVQAKRLFGSQYEPLLWAVKDKKHYTFNADAIKVEAKTGAHRKLIDYRKRIPAPYATTKVPGNVWYFPRVRYRMPEYENHPTQKPERLLERIILASSDPDDTVLDLFAGTFTTGAVAKRYGRRSISIELQEEYVQIGLRRLGISPELSLPTDL